VHIVAQPQGQDMRPFFAIRNSVSYVKRDYSNISSRIESLETPMEIKRTTGVRPAILNQ
jgi:hypothetical protein